MSLQTIYVVDHVLSDRCSLVSRLRELGSEAWPFAERRHFIEMLPRLEPSCIILDMELPPSDGLAVFKELEEREISWPVIATSADAGLRIAVDAMKLGAIDYLQKPVLAEELKSALSAASLALKHTAEAGSIRRLAEERVAKLSPREMEIGAALLRGLPNKMAAYQLGLSVRTVEMHRAHILQKLGVRNLAEGAAMLTQAGVTLSQFQRRTPTERSMPAHAA